MGLLIFTSYTPDEAWFIDFILNDKRYSPVYIVVGLGNATRKAQRVIDDILSVHRNRLWLDIFVYHGFCSQDLYPPVLMRPAITSRPWAFYTNLITKATTIVCLRSPKEITTYPNCMEKILCPVFILVDRDAPSQRISVSDVPSVIQIFKGEIYLIETEKLFNTRTPIEINLVPSRRRHLLEIQHAFEDLMLKSELVTVNQIVENMTNPRNGRMDPCTRQRSVVAAKASLKLMINRLDRTRKTPLMAQFLKPILDNPYKYTRPVYIFSSQTETGVLCSAEMSDSRVSLFDTSKCDEVLQRVLAESALRC